VVELISSIAAQTNLLALNATIEAAHRRGVRANAVVRRCADQRQRLKSEMGRFLRSIRSAYRGHLRLGHGFWRLPPGVAVTIETGHFKRNPVGNC
jgi:hypothetical protein